MKAKSNLLILFLPFLIPSAFAAPGGPEWRLRKLSLHVRGLDPSLAEYDAVKKAGDEGTLESFFAAKAGEYVKSPEHIALMDERLTELFRFRTAQLPTERYFSNLLEEESMPYDPNSNLDYARMPLQSANGLFRELAQKNLSWDALLLGSSYRAFPQQDYRKSGYLSGNSPDFDFFSNLLAADEMKKTEVREFGKVLLTPADPEDGRLAGAVTTDRFFKRYANTNTNKNRRRAAAVFSLFLCDEMRPVAVPSDSEDQRFVDLSLGAASSEHSAAMQGERRHASDPACASCHYKLDPVASLFNGFGDLLPADATRGALIYKIFSKTGQVEKSVNVPVMGMRELGRALVAQREFASCQVKHFWNWFIGSDVVLSPEREDEMLALFDAKGRKVNDFVAALVNQPEFYTPPPTASPAMLAYRKAEKVLKECTSCHVMNPDAPKPAFDSFPIGGTGESHLKWIKRISTALDLKNTGAAATMPPAYVGWDKATVKEMITTVKAWVCLGAPDSNGIPTAKEFGASVCE